MRRGRKSASGALLAALLLVLLSGCGGEQAVGSKPPATSAELNRLPPGKYLYLAGDHHLTIVDVDAGVRWAVRFPRIAVFEPPPVILRRGRRLVYYGADGDIDSIDLNLLQRPLKLGEAGPDKPGYFVPSASPNRVWVAGADSTAHGAPESVREVTATGKETYPATQTPREGAPTVAFRDALGIASCAGWLKAWNPKTGVVSSKLRTVAPGPTYGNLFVTTNPPRANRLRLINIATHRYRVLVAPAGFAGFDYYFAAFSPNGRMLAVPITGVPATRTGANFAVRRLAIIDVATREVRVIPGSKVQALGRVTWASDGSSVFMSGSANGRSQIVVYRLGQGRAHRIPVTVGAISSMAAS